MSGVFHFIRKRATRRRFVGLWLGLVALELFCPALCERTYASFTTSNTAPIEISSSTKTQSDPEATSVSACNDLGEHHRSTVCNDECLCHASAIPVVAIDMTKASFKSDRLLLPFVEGIVNSLPPPYLPPKFS